MKEQQIFCNAQSVRAILSDQKTMMRRPVRLPKSLPPGVFEYEHIPEGHFTIMREHGRFVVVHWETDHAECIPLKCPYQIGDRLWVRETWAVLGLTSLFMSCEVAYRADSEFTPAVVVHSKRVSQSYGWGKATGLLDRRWRPSIHMPRWASRILLEVTDVRAERVQDISIQDAIAEGISLDGLHDYPAWDFSDSVLVRFADLWDSIYTNGWEQNDFVWVLEFKRLPNDET